MKLKTKLLKKKFKTKHSESAPSSSSRPAWMITDREEQRSAFKEAQAMNNFRPPEFWLTDGEEKRIRFRDADPVASIWRYSIQVDGQWRQFTKPAPGELDLFEENGFQPQLKTIYEIIDLKGYIDKKTEKRKRNIARFFS